MTDEPIDADINAAVEVPVAQEAAAGASGPDDQADGHVDRAPDGSAAEADRERRRALEAVLLVADDPVSPQELAEVLEMSVAHVEALCTELSDSYERECRGFVLTRVGGGYRYQTHPAMAAYVERFVTDTRVARLSAAALETLAIVAYKQPVSRAQLALIRGVTVDGVMRTLTQRGYVAEVGTDPGPGQAVLFGTTRLFLEHLGIDSVADLPPVADFVPGADIMEALEAGLGVDGR